MLRVGKEVGRNFFCSLNSTVFQFQKLSSIITVFVCLSTTNKFCKEGETGLLLKVGKVLIVLDQDLVLFLCPLVLVYDVLVGTTFLISFLPVNSKDCLLVTEDDVVVVGTVVEKFTLSVVFLIE